MPKVARVINLTDAHKQAIDKLAPMGMDMREMARQVFNNQSLDLRSAEVKAIRTYIASGCNADLIEKYQAIELTDEQKAHIKNNYQQSSVLEMAKLLSKAPNGGRGMRINHPWAIAVQNYIKELDPNYNTYSQGVDSEYIPPRTLSDAVELVNKYAQNPRNDGKKILERSKLMPSEQRNLIALIERMNRPLFIVQANKYTKKIDRDLFESELVNLTWDKYDLTPEQTTQYITFASETVKYTQIEQQAQLIDDQINDALTCDDSQDVKMTKVELLNSIREKANASLKQQSALLKSLVTDRSKMINEKMAANGSLHNLVTAWQNKSKREEIIKMNQLTTKAKLEKEIDRLSDMDALKAEMFGLSRDDIMR